MFDSQLDRVRIASPCKSDWNQMYGDNRRRFCSECKMNVYNLSEMTRQEAETLLTASEGQLCVRFYRRHDGTVLTRDCPAGWKAIKGKASRMTMAACSLVTGFFAGLLSLRGAESVISYLPMGDVPPVQLEWEGPAELEQEKIFRAVTGELVNYEEWEGKVDVLQTEHHAAGITVGQLVDVEHLEKRKVRMK